TIFPRSRARWQEKPEQLHPKVAINLYSVRSNVPVIIFWPLPAVPLERPHIPSSQGFLGPGQAYHGQKWTHDRVDLHHGYDRYMRQRPSYLNNRHSFLTPEQAL